ncbi:MAG: GntR family transcriptional regulator [Victivallales bacterium]
MLQAEQRKWGYLQIADHLEAQIHSGVLKPNEKLKTTEELASEYDVTTMTIQRGLSRIVAKGLIRRNPRRGSFVSSSVKGKVVGVLFGGNPLVIKTPFYRLLLNSLLIRAAKEDMSIQPYFDYDLDNPYQGIRAVEKDVRDGNIKCLIPLCTSIQQSAWLDGTSICPVIDSPGLDLKDMARLGIEHLLAKGRRRIKFFLMYSPNMPNIKQYDAEINGIKAAFKTAGIKPPPMDDILVFCDDKFKAGYEVMKTMLAKGNIDGIIVNHDILVQGILIALLGCEVKLPKDISLVCHENKGAEHISPVELTKLLVDPDDFAKAIVEYIIREWNGLKPGRHSTDANVKAKLILGASS